MSLIFDSSFIAVLKDDPHLDSIESKTVCWLVSLVIYSFPDFCAVENKSVVATIAATITTKMVKHVIISNLLFAFFKSLLVSIS